MIERWLCILFGHRWHYWTGEGRIVTTAQVKYAIRACRRCGKVGLNERPA